MSTYSRSLITVSKSFFVEYYDIINSNVNPKSAAKYISKCNGRSYDGNLSRVYAGRRLIQLGVDKAVFEIVLSSNCSREIKQQAKTLLS